VEARLPRGKLRLLNVHLRPPIGDSGRTSTVASAYFYTRPIRLREIQQHFKRVPSGGPLVVLGDFNESGDGRANRWLKRQGLKSALAAHDPKAPTWRWRTALYTFRARLDHIYYRGLRCLGAQVLGYAASDHHPIEAVFTF
jgi:endonuclease/exonuclease/phosphatase (EEP) superfamily protein YafD